MAEVGFERLAVALDDLRAAIPASVRVDAESTLAVSDTENRRLLEEILLELQKLNARSQP